MKKETKKQEVIEQVDVQEICKKHNIGRYDLILYSTVIARELELTPHQSLKKILASDDLEELMSQARTAQFSKDLKGL